MSIGMANVYLINKIYKHLKLKIMIQKKKFSDAIAANISVVGELLPEVTITQKGVVSAGFIGGVSNAGTYKNLKLFRGLLTNQYASLLKIYHSNTNRVFLIECNNGSFYVKNISGTTFGYKFYTKNNFLYVSINPLASFSANMINFSKIPSSSIIMEADNEDLSEAEIVTVNN